MHFTCASLDWQFYINLLIVDWGSKRRHSKGASATETKEHALRHMRSMHLFNKFLNPVNLRRSSFQEGATGKIDILKVLLFASIYFN